MQTLDDDVIFVPSDMIIADWPARVGTVFVDEGETVQLGKELLTLTEPDFTITLFANPTDRSEIALGQVVTVELEAGDQEVEGRIVELDDAAIITDGGGERYEGVVDVTGELAAVDGATVRIEVVLDERIDAMVVPRAAVFQDATGNPACGSSMPRHSNSVSSPSRPASRRGRIPKSCQVSTAPRSSWSTSPADE